MTINFIHEFLKLQKSVHKNAKEKGWHDQERNEGEIIALIHSELSEGLEALRKNLESDKIPGFLGIEEELADVIIRIMDYAELKNYCIASAIIEKMEYNKNRSYKHGNKKF